MSSETNKNLGVGVVGSLKKRKKKKRKKKKSKAVEPATKNSADAAKKDKTKSLIRTIRLEYLQSIAKTIATMNTNGEYEIKPTKNCEEGDEVWFIETDNTFIKTKIYKSGD